LELYVSADRNGLLALLAATLGDRMSLRPGYDPLDNVLRVALREASEARRIHLDILQVLCATFRAAGIRWAVMDGPSIAERFYKVPASRCYHRLQVLVAPGAAAQAMESLESVGFSTLAETSTQQLSQCDSEATILRNASRLHEICLHAPRGERTSFDVPALLQTADILSVEGIEVPAVCQSDQIVLSCTTVVDDRQKDALIHLYDIALMAQSASQQICTEIVAKADRQQCIDTVERAVQRAVSTFPLKGPGWLGQALRRERRAATGREA
jgi:hypothetical protein